VSMRPYLLIPAFGISLAFTTATAQNFTVTDLGTLRGYPTSTTTPLAINEAGEITGYVLLPNPAGGASVSEAFLYRDGRIITFAGENTSATAIAAGPRMAGSATFSGFPGPHAFLYEDHLLRDLGTPPDTFESYASGVNSKNEVVGGSLNYEATPVAFLYSQGNIISLFPSAPLQGPGSDANGINNAGDVTGTAYGFEDLDQAFLYQNGKVTYLGTLIEANASHGTAINDTDQIAGTSFTNYRSFVHAFLWSKGQMLDLGLPPNGIDSSANALNNEGQVVGSSTVNATTGATVAFLYRDGKMSDLNTLIPPHSGWVLSTATGINSRGQIIGTGQRNGVVRGFLLNPDCRDRRNRDCDFCRHERQY
jgi:probable HAF family extracellular repeat protein